MAAKPGALIVFVELGPDTTPEEFNEMYENDHVPPRMALPEFTEGIRLVAADGQKPTYGGVFAVSDLGVVQSPAVAALMANRSERELKISGAYTVNDRRVYALTYDSLQEGFKGPEGQESKFVLVVGITSSEQEEVDKWYLEEHLEMLRAVPGWVRSRRFVYVGGQAIGTEGKEPAKALALHEFTSAAIMKTEEFKKATTTEWRDRVVAKFTDSERRAFDVYAHLRK